MKPQYEKLLRILKRGNAAFVLVDDWDGEPERIRVVTPEGCQWYSVRNVCFVDSCFLRLYGWFGFSPTPEDIVRAMERHDHYHVLEISHVQELK